ncbi:MAG: trigger factor [Candidatus Marinimicrobia bacterium]|nr:trigger factor [Candidatus Neomarinimicrobiota bacterium]MCF7829791.1 trigger factor [Candidatus Neomarinimicrobiota bacterium]MCF7881776.1 trigger factor [Candidatus Neomarinimicrobiota bacterium]
MKVNVETGEKDYERVMTVEVPWEEIEDEFQETFQEFRSELEMPGFRKGKVPKQVVKQKHGQQIEYQFAADAIDDYYRKALDEIDDEPVNRGTIEDLEFSEGQPLTFSARFEVEPEVEIFEYKDGFKIEHTAYDSTPADVDQALDDLRERHAEMEEIEDGAEEGHLVLVDLQRVEPDGTPIIGQKVEDRYIKLGDGVFGGDNLERLQGAKKGDTRRIVLDEEATEGEVEYYDADIKKVEEQKLPELDDEFAEHVQGESSTYDELRTEIQKNIQSQLDDDANNQLQQKIAHQFVTNSEVEVPESMVDNYLDMLIEDVKRQREQEGQPPEIDEEAFKQNYRTDAIFNLKWQLIKKQIIEAEDLEVEEEAVEARIDEVLDNYPEENREAVKNLYKNPQYRQRIEEDLLDDVVMDHIKSFVEIDETRKTTTEARQEQEARRAAESAVDEAGSVAEELK